MRTLFFAPNEQASRTVFLVQELMCLLAMLSQNRILNVSQTEKHVPGSTAARRGPAGERGASVLECCRTGFPGAAHDNWRSMMARESACGSCRKDSVHS